MSRIDEPTAEEFDLLLQLQKKWERIILSTEPVDRQKAEANVDVVYRAAGFDAPRTKLWFDSPYEATKAALSIGPWLLGRGRPKLWFDADASVRQLVDWPNAECLVDEILEHRDRSVNKIIRLYQHLVANIGFTPPHRTEGPGFGLRHAVSRAVFLQIGLNYGFPTQPTTSIFDALGTGFPAFDGPTFHWSSWASASFLLAASEFLHNLGWISAVEPVMGYVNLAGSSHWFYPFQSVAMLVDRPRTIHLDSESRLHNDSGPAIVYRDGWSVYSWRGIPVPQEAIEGPVTLERIEDERNMEVRRVLIEIYGIERYMRESDVRTVARDEFGVLIEKGLRGGPFFKMVRVINSTPESDGSSKEYLLRVPPQMRTPREAVAWTFGLRPDEYRPLMQT